MWCLVPTKRTEQSPPFETKGQKCLREAPVSIILSAGKDWVSFLTCLRVICTCFSLFVCLQVISVLVLNHQAQGQSLSTRAVSTAAEWTRHLTGQIQGQTPVPSAQASRRTLGAHTDNTHSAGPCVRAVCVSQDSPGPSPSPALLFLRAHWVPGSRNEETPADHRPRFNGKWNNQSINLLGWLTPTTKSTQADVFIHFLKIIAQGCFCCLISTTTCHCHPQPIFSHQALHTAGTERQDQRNTLPSRIPNLTAF